jgi:hypothetical protein
MKLIFSRRKGLAVLFGAHLHSSSEGDFNIDEKSN